MELIIDNLEKKDYEILVYPNRKYRKLIINTKEINIIGLDEVIKESDIYYDYLKEQNEVLREELDEKIDVIIDLRQEIKELKLNQK